MPYSTGYFKEQTINYIIENYSESTRILDIGAGAGTYSDLLTQKGYRNLDCIEAFEEYVSMFSLKDKYREVFIGEASQVLVDYTKYDLIIMGDVLEHMTVSNAQALLQKLKGRDVIIAVPFESEQGESFNNKYETHLQFDLTLQNFLTRYPGFSPLCLRFDYGVFVKRTPKIIYIETQEKPLPQEYSSFLTDNYFFCEIKNTSPDSIAPEPLAQNPVTVVTGLWNIGRSDIPESFKRDYADYLTKFSELLRADIPMYIFADKSDEDFIWQHRKKSNTVVNCMSLQELKAWFAFTGKVNAIRQQPSWRSQAPWLSESPQALLEEYNPIVMSKMFMLNNVTVWNPFNSEYFFWIDAGITSTVHYGYFSHDKVFSNLPNYCTKHGDFIYLSYPYEGGGEIHGFERSAIARYCGVPYVDYVCRGGFFGGKREAVNQINGAYYAYLDASLSENYMGTEESIFTIVAHNYPDSVHRFKLEGNGLVWPFFEELKDYKVPVDSREVALYVLTYNSPKQFETLCKSFEEYDKTFLTSSKKYLLNNSTDSTTDQEYSALCALYDFEEIKKGNLGICGGRQFIAEHFDKTPYDYCIFYEDDMFFHLDGPTVCRNGFPRKIPALFKTVTTIMKKEEYDFLKFNFSEFFGDNSTQWAWYNVPQTVREEHWPSNCKLPEVGLSKNAPRTKFTAIKSLNGVAYAEGEIYYCNWPQIVSKSGNRKMFLETQWQFPYEQTWMSHMFQETLKQNIKPAILLATPTEHNRFDHYPASERREH